MTSAEALYLRDYLLQVIEGESATTRRVLAALPAARLEYRPGPKAMSARELAWHIAEAEPLLLEVVARGSFDGVSPAAEVPATIEAILAHYDRHLGPGLARVRAVSAEQLLQPVNLFGASDLLVRRLAYVPFHAVHHRGQLSAYLRAMGAFVPGCYGWSADERERARLEEAK